MFLFVFFPLKLKITIEKLQIMLVTRSPQESPVLDYLKESVRNLLWNVLEGFSYKNLFFGQLWQHFRFNVLQQRLNFCIIWLILDAFKRLLLQIYIHQYCCLLRLHCNHDLIAAKGILGRCGSNNCVKLEGILSVTIFLNFYKWMSSFCSVQKHNFYPNLRRLSSKSSKN